MPILASPARITPRLWRFGRVLYDEGASELRVDGLVVEVERKPLEVLSVLLDHVGKVVTKGDLVQLAWPGRVIGDAAVAKSIARLREAIGDAGHDIVRTHHRYGYRLVAELVIESTPAAPQPVAIPALPPAAVSTRTDAEHRVLTMLFCDLVDSTRIAESLDPEIFRTLLLDYQSNASEIVRRYEGHVAQQFGDGLLFWFGHPEAHDDDAERALRCACELLRFASRAGAYTHLSLRIGVHTGPVVIGAPGPGADVQATGAHINLASRLQSLAEPDTVLASDATFRLVPGLFVTRDFGPQTLRGLAEPVRVHQVLQPSGARSRLDAQARLTPFVGRNKEIALAETCWREAVEGRGQTILFSGEPGLGKSRLLMELRLRLAGSAYTWLEGRSDALNRHSAFHVITELLRRGFALKDSDDDAQRLLDLEKRLDDLELDRDTTIPLLAPLLNLPSSERYPDAKLAPEQKRARTLDTLANWITRLAEEQPLVLVIEDLHWCDDSTLEFIGSLLARNENLPLLLVMTARPEFTPNWPASAALHTATLDGLDRAQVERMLIALSGDQALTSALTRKIIERAAGVPLFVEELARSIQEAGTTRTPDAVPDSLNSLLRARLDRLGPARELIQTLAVTGMECDHVLLQQVSGLDDTALKTHLERLTDSGLIYFQGSAPNAPEARFVFKHALIRDSAYAALLNSTRQRLHARAAEAIETLHAQRLDEHSGELAHHCEQAGQAERAAGYAQKAGESAMRRSANREAAVHLATAIRLTEALTPTAETRRNLVSLHSNLGVTLTAINGYSDPLAHDAYEKARALAQHLGDAPDLAPVIAGLGAYYLMTAKHTTAHEILRELDDFGARTALPTACIAAKFFLGQAHFCMGHFDAAERALHESIALYECENARDIAFLYQEDSRSSGLTTLGLVQWFRGYPDLAERTSRAGVEYAHELGHAFSIAIARTLQAWCAQLRGDVPRVLELARKSVEYSTEHGFPYFAVWSEILLGWAEAQSGRAGEAVTRIACAMQIFNGNGLEFLRGWASQLLAEAMAIAGRKDEALVTLDEALRAAIRNDEGLYLPEIHRLHGELLLATGHDATEVENCFRKALEAARTYNARALELRAATSLARLMQQQGRGHEALITLEPVYDGFTEGFDTPDLRKAAALIEALGLR